jgi:hypothetical protein
MSERPDLAEARRWAEMSPQQRAEETLGPGRQSGERLGDRKLTEVEYATLTFDERKLYAARQSARR